MASAELYVPTTNTGMDWPRRVANAVNPMLRRLAGLEKATQALTARVEAAEEAATALEGRVAGAETAIADLTERVAAAESLLTDRRGYAVAASEPTSPDEGDTYYDTTLHVMRTWNGLAWNNHW